MAVVQTQIDGAFKGAEGKSIYRLTNGQIWEQSQYLYHYHYAYRPYVVITGNDQSAVMRVDGMGADIPVRRIR